MFQRKSITVLKESIIAVQKLTSINFQCEKLDYVRIFYLSSIRTIIVLVYWRSFLKNILMIQTVEQIKMQQNRKQNYGAEKTIENVIPKH